MCRRTPEHRTVVGLSRVHELVPVGFDAPDDAVTDEVTDFRRPVGVDARRGRRPVSTVFPVAEIDPNVNDEAAVDTVRVGDGERRDVHVGESGKSRPFRSDDFVFLVRSFGRFHERDDRFASEAFRRFGVRFRGDAVARRDGGRLRRRRRDRLVAPSPLVGGGRNPCRLVCRGRLD
ncbi:hypothetical protein [Haladaptatus sp. NG-WS-4]